MNNFDKLKELVETDTDFADFFSDLSILQTINCLQEDVLIDRDYNASINILAKGKGLAFVGEEWLHSLMNQEATSFTA